jgi:hypothetical protein
VISVDALTGLTSTHQYVVQTIDANNSQLLSGGSVVPLQQNSSTCTYTFTDGTNLQTLSLALVDPVLNTITLAGNTFTDVETIPRHSTWAERALAAALSGPTKGRSVVWAARRAQRRSERLHGKMRRDFLNTDIWIEDAIAFAGESE